MSDFSQYPSRFCSSSSGAIQLIEFSAFCGRLWSDLMRLPLDNSDVACLNPAKTAFVWFRRIDEARIDLEGEKP
jgi:hypothetical protein